MEQHTLTSRQREILIGTLLGDGHLETRTNGRTYRLKIEHTIDQQRYVAWLYQEFQNAVTTPPQIRIRPAMSWMKKKEYTRCWFNTRTLGSLRFYAQQFYRDGKKIVPQLIYKWLTPLAIAVWYMDDGSIKSKAHSTVLMNTQSFDRGDIEQLRKAFQTRYGIATSLQKQKDGTRLYFLSETIEVLRGVMMPHILPSMHYKVPRSWLTQLPKK